MNMKLTPTECLILEVLAARRRLGEVLWTFDTSTRPSALKLESKGLITVIHGIVEKTYRASLTQAGADECMKADYVSPLERTLASQNRKIKKLKRLI